MTCSEARVALGALLLGALDSREAAALRDHVAQCARCTAEHDQLEPLVRYLALLPLEDNGGGEGRTEDQTWCRLIDRVMRKRRRPKRYVGPFH